MAECIKEGKSNEEYIRVWLTLAEISVRVWKTTILQDIRAVMDLINNLKLQQPNTKIQKAIDTLHTVLGEIIDYMAKLKENAEWNEKLGNVLLISSGHNDELQLTMQEYIKERVLEVIST